MNSNNAEHSFIRLWRSNNLPTDHVYQTIVTFMQQIDMRVKAKSHEYAGRAQEISKECAHLKEDRDQWMTRCLYWEKVVGELIKQNRVQQDEVSKIGESISRR